ncbi:MAG: aspartate 1-decarboxylase [Actinomycetota bacterium]
MKRTMLYGKIHRATVTDANVDYEGSITVDPALTEAAGMIPYEKVQVLDVDNGVRLETYLIEGERDSGGVVINGAAAHLIPAGHRVIICSYVQMKDSEARAHAPKLVLVNAGNRPATPLRQAHAAGD